MRAHLANMVKGVTDGCERKLEINGVGYRAEVAGDKLNMALGFSHPVVFELPKGVDGQGRQEHASSSRASTASCSAQTAAKIRELRPPEPYKGKGIKYVEEVIKRKVGKTGATSGGEQPTRIRHAHRHQQQEREPQEAAPLAPQADRGHRRASAPGGVPQRQAHLRPGHRRRDAARRWPPPRRSTRRSRRELDGLKKTERAKKVGAAIAEKCKEKGIDKVVFDRNGYMYHGRVSALADGAREAGLKF